MNSKTHIQRSGKAPQKRRMLIARMGMALAALAYFFTAVQIAPLMFAAIGASMDRQHEVRVQMTKTGVQVTLVHSDGLFGNCATRHGHTHQWPALILVGPEVSGSSDHVADFSATETGVSSSSEGIDVKCPVSEMPPSDWLPLVANSHAPVVTGAVGFESFAPPDIRPMRPVVLLI